MNIRIKRVSDTPGIGTWGMDTDFINASITRMPKLGERIQISFDRLGKGSWCSLPVVEIKTRPGKKIYVTASGAEYHIKRGESK